MIVYKIDVLAALLAAVILPGFYRRPLVYDVLLWAASLLMAGAAVVFLQRGLSLLAPGRCAMRGNTLTASLALTAALCPALFQDLPDALIDGLDLLAELAGRHPHGAVTQNDDLLQSV